MAAMTPSTPARAHGGGGGEKASGGSSKVVKILLWGGPETGKSALLASFNQQVFEPLYTPTGSDFSVKQMTIAGSEVTVTFWDIGSGSNHYKTFLRGTQGVLLVADLTQLHSMDGLDAMYERVKALVGFADDSFPCALVGNKLDLCPAEREVSMDDLRHWCQKRRPHSPDSISFHEASGKSGANVSEVFEGIVFQAVSQPAKMLSTPTTSVVGASSYFGGSDYSNNSRTPLTASMMASRLAGASAQKIEEKEDEDEDIATAKVIIAGAPSVGKTCILQRFVGDDKDTFGRYEPTIGADFRISKMPVADRELTLQIWDSAGDHKMLNIGRSIYKNADCLVLVYDITSRESFEALEIYWNNYLLYGRPHEPDEFPCLLVGNKSDLCERRAVTLDEVTDWCVKKRPKKPITHVECSALRSIAVKDIFIVVADMVGDYLFRVEDGTETDSDNEDGTSTGYCTSHSHGTGLSYTPPAQETRSGSARRTPNGHGGRGGEGGDKNMEQTCSWIFNCL